MKNVKEKILKAVKGLKNFTIEDIESITGFDQFEILEIIRELPVKKSGNVYIYENIKPESKQTIKRKTGIVSKNIYFKTFAQRFMNTLTCSNTTKRSYEIYLRLHINPYFKNKRLIDISATDIENFKHKKIKEGCSNKNTNNFISLISRVFEYAINQNLHNKNPCRNIERPELRFKKKKVTQEQINNLLNKAKEKDYGFYVLLLTAIETGLPRGQILDLTWDNVKNINMSLKLKHELHNWQGLCPATSINLVFPNKIGNKICADNMIKRKFKPIAKLAGLEDLRFIDLKIK